MIFGLPTNLDPYICAACMCAASERKKSQKQKWRAFSVRVGEFLAKRYFLFNSFLFSVGVVFMFFCVIFVLNN